MTTENNVGEVGGDFDAWQIANYYLKPIKEFLSEDAISEIMVNRFDEIYVERAGEIVLTQARFKDEQSLKQAIVQVANALGQVADPLSHPILDARLQDGSRICAVLEPTSVRGSALSIRVFPKTRFTANDLVKRGALSAQMLDYMRVAVLTYSNMLVSGGTSSGKTTLLNALSSLIPRDDRVITAEDTNELHLDLPQIVSLEAPHTLRPHEDAQKIDLTFLIKTTLRLKPTRLIVGEIRDASAATAFLQAINTGHSGCSSTIHANSATNALIRMQTLVAGGEAGLPYDVVRDQVCDNLHVLVHAERTPKHGRRIVQIAELKDNHPRVVFEFDFRKGAHVVDEDALRTSSVLERGEKYGIERPDWAPRP